MNFFFKFNNSNKDKNTPTTPNSSLETFNQTDTQACPVPPSPSPSHSQSNNMTIHPCGHQQSLLTLVRSISSSYPPPPRRFLENLALRSRNRRQSQKRIFIDLPDCTAFFLMALQQIIWIAICVFCLFSSNFDQFNNPKIKVTIHSLIRLGPFLILYAMVLTFLSTIILYNFTIITVHLVSLSVLLLTIYNAASNLFQLKFSSGNFASLLTFIFLSIYYFRALKHLPLTSIFIKSSAKICWRNHVSLLFIFAAYAVLVYSYLIVWSFSILVIQESSNIFRLQQIIFLIMSTISMMLFSAFLRDLLQIWISRIIYNSTFAHTQRPVIVTSLTRNTNTNTKAIEDIENNIPNTKVNGLRNNSLTSSSSSLSDNVMLSSLSDSSFEETQRLVSRESLWWCVGTAARSAFHLVLRGFQVHIWILALIQIIFPNFGPPADPQCVLDIFHVPTAIYGTSFIKSRKFVNDTMVDHGMDKISVDIYLRTFIYYMMSYACLILGLLSTWYIFGDNYRFKTSFFFDSMWSLLNHSESLHFACFFIIFGVVLVLTAIDSVHMILCWSICESPTSVSALEPDLMYLLVATYHARLDLRRFSGDRIHTNTFKSASKSIINK